MNLQERASCDGLDDASIMETMAWLKEQCLVLQFELESSGKLITNDMVRDNSAPPIGGSEQ